MVSTEFPSYVMKIPPYLEKSKRFISQTSNPMQTNREGSSNMYVAVEANQSMLEYDVGRGRQGPGLDWICFLARVDTFFIFVDMA